MHATARRTLPAGWQWAVICLSAALIPASTTAQDVDWLNRTALRQELNRPVVVFWDGQNLREALRSFSRQQRVAVLLDRRVDPSRLVTLRLTNVPLQQALYKIAASQNLGVSRVGPVVYFGPPEAARVLASSVALSNEELSAGRPSATVRRAWNAEHNLTWPDLQEPKALLSQLARESSANVTNINVIPHDLWSEADLPPLSLMERLSLVLVQFNLAPSVTPDGRKLTFVDLPSDPVVSRNYDARGVPADEAAAWRKALPGATVKLGQGKMINVRGLVEDHEWIEDQRRPKSRPAVAAPDASAARYNLTIKNKKLGEVLPALAQGFGIELKIDAPALAQGGVSLDSLISYEAKDETADEILRGVTRPLGLEYTRTGKSAVIALPATGSDAKE